MKKIYQILAFALLYCLHTNQLIGQGCSSYESAFPPPYPSTYPCIQAVFAADPLCCSNEFDAFCVEQMITICDINPSPCRFEQCKAAGCAATPFPFCPTPCPSYSSFNPPPGPNPPDGLDGVLFEMIYFDGSCCTSEWDALCWSALDSISVFRCNDNNPNTIDGCTSELGCTHTPIPTNPRIRADIKVMLEGAYLSNGLMKTTLRANNLIPPTQPFSGSPWGYTGTETITTVATLPANVVDWVLIELRNPLNYSQIVGRAAGLLLSNGTVVQHSDPTKAIEIDDVLPNSNYYIIVRTRGHLPVMSKMPIYLSNYAQYDFTRSLDQVYGNNQMKSLGVYDPTPGGASGDEYTIYGLYAGDFNSDGRISVPDFTNVYITETSIKQYKRSDVNYDARVTVADYNLNRLNSGVMGVSHVQY